MKDNFIPIEDKGYFNYEWHSAKPYKEKIATVNINNIQEKSNINIHKLTERQLKDIATQILNSHEAAFKLNREQRRKAIKNIIKDIKSGKIKL